MQPIVKEEISKRVLTFGPAYKNHRGGIGAVIDVYSTFFERFNFVPSYLSYDSNLSKIFYFFRQVAAFTRVLSRNKEISIVHLHGSHGGSFYRKYTAFLVAKRLFRKKIVYHIHSGTFNTFYLSSNGIQRRLIRNLVNNADSVICLAPVWEKFITDNFTCRNIFIVNNVVPEPPVKSSPGTLNSGMINLLFLGKVGDNKGIFDLVEILRRSRTSFEGRLRLTIGGDGEIDKLKKIISEHKLEAMVEYAGWVNKENKRELFLQTNIYILPSYNEGLPGSILEAMSYGLPIIATPVGGIPEVVKDGVNGILVTPGNLDEIEKSLLFFLNDKQRMSEYGNASLAMIGPYFPAHVSAQLQQLYQSML